ncbi:SusC/RagA family TonB-linked outer membrane protein [Sinomicrobium sp. M5D2P9]
MKKNYRFKSFYRHSHPGTGKVPVKQMIRIMKIYVVLVCLTIGELFAANLRAQNISLRMEQQNLSEALAVIEQKTDYHFFYNARLVDVSKKVSINVSDMELEEALKQLLHHVNIDYKLVKDQIVLFPKGDTYVVEMIEELLEDVEEKGSGENQMESQASNENAANLNRALQDLITGNVTDEDGVPLPGVNIVVKGTTIGTQTDFDGNYTISASEGQVLIFSYVGQKTQEVAVGSSGEVNVQMQEDAQALEEVIVVAYGTAKKESFTGSATQINADNLEKRTITNPLAALEGAAAGVNVSAANGQPGAPPNIRIRGAGSYVSSAGNSRRGSFSDPNSPIYIVDGVQFNGDLSSINSSDIASMTVLKDAASTSLYGSRAANGVVMIKTKSGKKGKGSVTLNISQGITSRSIPEYDRLNASQYYPLMWEALRNSLSISGTTPVQEANERASAEIFDELGQNPFNVSNDQIVLPNGQLNPNASLLYPEDLNWQKPLIRSGSRSNIDLSYGGGTEKSDYYASIGYLKEDGYILNSDFRRITARVNVNTELASWVKTGLNLSATDTESNQAADAGSSSYVNPFRTTRYIGPIYSVHQHDPVTGEYILDRNGQKAYDLGDNRVGGGGSGRNVIQETLLNIDQDKVFTVSTRAYAEFYFLNDFTFTVNGAIDKRYYDRKQFWNPVVGDGSPEGRSFRWSTNRTTTNFNQLLNYTKQIDKHNVSVLLGHESYETEYDNFYGARQSQVVDGNIELVNFITTQDLTSYLRKLTTEGYFARLNYDFDNKYFITGSYRRDGSSRFHKSERWGDFFSVGAAWRIDQENFLRDVDWIDLLKLRGSYGEVGNDNLVLGDDNAHGYYASYPLFALNYNNAGEGGILMETLGNENLKWETNVQSDVALEFGFLNNRISGTVEYYNRKSKDLLFRVPLPLSAGLDDFPDNIGSWTNSGFEIGLNFEIIQNENFSWDFNINASTLKNKITELSQDEIINGSKKLVVGGDFYNYWMRKWYGVDPADGAALYYASPEAIEAGSGDLREIDGTMVTTNHNNAEYGFAGTATPDVFGGFGSNINYKGFSLGFTFTYQIGGKIYDTNYLSLMHSGEYGTAWSTDILKRWQNPGDVTDVPRLDASQTTPFGAPSDKWLVKSDNLSLRQVNIGYNLNSTLTEAFGISSARIYASGENLFRVTARKGLDAGENFNGTTSNRFTPARVISMGLNITF